MSYFIPKVERGIAVTNPKHPQRTTRYPWPKMGMGDSFFAPDRTTAQLIMAANFYRKDNPGFRVTCRAIDGGVRVWRIA